MTPDTIFSHLRQADLADQLDLLADLREQMRRRTLDLDAQIARLEAEKRERLGWMTEAWNALIAVIKTQCLAQQRSAKGQKSGWQIIYVSGRTTWNTAQLDGYAVDHPEIQGFRRTGAPSAKIIHG